MSRTNTIERPRFRYIQALIAATLGAILVQPLVLLLYTAPSVLLSPHPLSANDLRQIAQLCVAVCLVAAAFILLLGLPLFAGLRRLKKDTAFNVGLAGFGAAAIPVAILFWPRREAQGSSMSATWHGQYVEFLRDGVPTTYAWLQFLEGSLFAGLHGLFGALAFLAIWRFAFRASC